MKCVCSLFCLSFFILSCRDSQPQAVSLTPEKMELPNQDSIRDNGTKREREREALAESLRFEKREQIALGKLEMYSGKKPFRFRSDTFQIEMGNLVNRSEKHALIKVFGSPGSGESDFYKILFYQDSTWRTLEKIEASVATIGAIFKDMNGDGHKDFVIESYGMAGTGEKYFNEVYLWNPRRSEFDYIEGLGKNPHFHTKKGVVTCYYNPLGIWSAEKYRLNWNKLEPLEEVEINIAGFENGKCARKIYHYRKGERYLFKQDKVCDFPPEYKFYEPLVLVIEPE